MVQRAVRRGAALEPGNRKGAKQTAAQREAALKNLAKGRAKKDAMAAQAKAEGRPSAGKRWRMLESGELSLADLDDEEIRRKSVRGKTGAIVGHRKISPALAEKFAKEGMRRAMTNLQAAGQRAAEGLVEMAEDPDLPPAVRLKALGMLLDRSLGKATETVKIDVADRFEDLMAKFVEIDREVGS